MISIEEALRIINANLPARREELLPLPEALDCYLAREIRAPEPSPRNTNSAMDGFAVRWEDVQSAALGRPVELVITGESRAGSPFEGRLGPGRAVRISTGAVLPHGGDTVIPVEDTETDRNRVTVRQARKRAGHVRFRGEEFQPGELLLSPRTGLFPGQLALLAAVGCTKVTVFRRPEVGLLVTGTELVPYTEPAEDHQIRDANSIMLEQAVRQSGGKPTFLERVGDSREKTIAGIQRASGACRLLIISGGVSVGPHDHVKDAATAAGFETMFWRIRQKPGKPFFFARREDRLLFGLPGNPVSALMGYVYYIHPLIRRLLGEDFHWVTVDAVLNEDLTNPSGRPGFFRLILDRGTDPPVAEPFPQQGSHMLTSIARTDGFTLLDAGETRPAGGKVSVYPFPWTV